MNILTLNGLDGLMSPPILRKILRDFPTFSLEKYFATLNNSVWNQKNVLNCTSTQLTIEEKYIFNLITLLQTNNSNPNPISESAALALRTSLNVIMDRLFESEVDHYNYLLEIIDNVDHPTLKETIYL